MFDYSSIRTIIEKFRNSGNPYLLQTLMKRFSNNDYSTCIILLIMKTYGFLTFSRSVEMWQWIKMG